MSMNYDQFTIKTQEALQEASSIANKNDNAEIAPEHVLQALLEQQDGLTVPVIERIGVSATELNNKVKDLVRSNPKVSGAAQVYFSSQTQKLLANAEKEMSALKDQYLSTEHLLLALAGKTIYNCPSGTAAADTRSPPGTPGRNGWARRSGAARRSL